MIDRSDETDERGLLLAVLKWDGKMQLTGSDEFIAQAITIAAHKKMQIEFSNPDHNAALKDLKFKIHMGEMEIANLASREKQRIQDEAEAGGKKNAKGVPTPGTPPKDKDNKDKPVTGTGTGTGTGQQPTAQPVQPQEPDIDGDDIDIDAPR